MKITRKDVAKRAGVSEAVVSYVINNSNYVKDETRKRVEIAIKELDYKPNLLARSLKTEKSKHLAFICNDFNNPFFSQMAAQVTKIAFENGYILSVNDVGYDDKQIELITQYQVDGMVICSDVFSTDEINSLVRKGTGVVLFKNRKYRDLDPRVALIDVDIYKGMCELMEYLKGKGHEHMSLISSSRLDRKRKENLRYRAFDKYQNESGDLHLIDSVTAYSEMNTIIDKILFERKATAIVCGNDAIALNVLKILREKNISVPEQMAVTGYDNISYVDLISPRLTTVDVRIKEISHTAIDLLLKIVRKEEYESVHWSAELKKGDTA